MLRPGLGTGEVRCLPARHYHSPKASTSTLGASLNPGTAGLLTNTVWCSGLVFCVSLLRSFQCQLSLVCHVCQIMLGMDMRYLWETMSKTRGSCDKDTPLGTELSRSCSRAPLHNLLAPVPTSCPQSGTLDQFLTTPLLGALSAQAPGSEQPDAPSKDNATLFRALHLGYLSHR